MTTEALQLSNKIFAYSYAMMGLLRQFQRTEQQIYEVVGLLIKAHYGIGYLPVNIPNKYLAS